ncbi:MAG: DUF4142 domain-containing protein [Gammaproteobacteria bacterium]
MQKNKLSMALLGVSASFALLTAFSAHAQSGTAAAEPQGRMGQSSTQGKTAADSGKALSAADQKLVASMAMANMAEIQTGKMAQQKTQNEQVKSYAQRMIDDHTRALNEVQQLAQNKGMTLPTELDKAHKDKAAKLEKLSGEQFDRAYMAQTGVADHKKTHALVSMGADKARDPDVKALAARLQPAVDEHLRMAQDMHQGHNNTAMGSSGARGSTASGASGNMGSTASGSAKQGGTTAIGPSGSPGTGSVTGVNGSGTPRATGKGHSGASGTGTGTGGTSTERR